MVSRISTLILLVQLADLSYRKANAIGRSSKTVREFLERNHKADMSREDTIKLTVKSLLEVVQTGAKNIEIAVLAPGMSMEMLSSSEIEKYVESVNAEKAEEDAKKRPGGPRGQTGTGTATVVSRPAADSAPAGEGAEDA